MQQVLDMLRSARDRRCEAVLCTVLATEGSSPRGAGAKMLVFPEGIAGTVGGGALERHVQDEARLLLGGGLSKVLRLRLGDDLGMACGGGAVVGLTPLSLLDDALFAEEEPPRGACLMLTFYADGRGAGTLLSDALDGAGGRPAFWDGDPVRYAEPLSLLSACFVYGAGHVSRALVPLLAGVGFSVTVTDDRPEMLTRERFLQAERLLVGAFDALLPDALPPRGGYAVVLTHGHRYDTEVLMQLLPRETAYIGCIGSRRKVAAVNAALSEAGFSDADIRRVHAPIGLSIGAQTPEEIAVSIAAELIAVRAGVTA